MMAACRTSRNCPECGANLSKENESDTYICNHCGWKEGDYKK